MDLKKYGVVMPVIAALLFGSGCPRLGRMNNNHIKELSCKCLQKGESIFSDDMFNLYMDVCFNRGDFPTLFQVKESMGESWVALCINRPMTKVEKGIFAYQAKKRGYSKSEIDGFYSKVDSAGKIIISESELLKGNFKDILLHERVHREVQNLSLDDREIIREAYEGLKKRKSPYGSKKFIEGKIGTKGDIANEKFVEFLPYLANGYLENRVERILKKNYPKAYGIYEGVLRKAIGDDRECVPRHLSRRFKK